VTKVYEFGGGKVKEHLGGIYDFLQSKRIDNLDNLGQKSLSSQSTPSIPKNEPKVSSGATDYAARKEQAKQQRKLQKRVEECEKRVATLEAEIAEWDTKLSAPEEHGIDLSDSKVFEDYNALKQRLAFEEHEWEKLCYELEILQEN
jgi:ATP-binding cassette subfamily F protein 3